MVMNEWMNDAWLMMNDEWMVDDDDGDGDGDDEGWMMIDSWW